MFRVAGLYGVSRDNVPVPLNEREAIDSGPLFITADPVGDAASNVGMIDFDRRTLRVRYGVQIAGPALLELSERGDFDPALLSPPRAIVDDECTLEPEMLGWSAFGTLHFLPGSYWSGAGGG